MKPFMKGVGIIISGVMGIAIEDAIASFILFLILNFLIGVTLPFIKIWGFVLMVHILLNYLKNKGFLK